MNVEEFTKRNTPMTEYTAEKILHTLNSIESTLERIEEKFSKNMYERTLIDAQKREKEVGKSAFIT